MGILHLEPYHYLLSDYESKFKKGDNLIFAAFGGGFNWGSVYLKWAYNS
jgi:3-oxoacyl-[acyl-carrier-protein] synthase-3